ncbi:hypothetical protein pb186bvf_018276 [Paramecium bursaria]
MRNIEFKFSYEQLQIFIHVIIISYQRLSQSLVKQEISFQYICQQLKNKCSNFKIKINTLNFQDNQHHFWTYSPNIFRILKKQKFTTWLCHILTIIIAFACFIIFFISMQELLQQANPSVVFKEEQLINSDPVYLFQNNFTLVMTLAYLNVSALQTYNLNYQFQIQNCYRKRNFDPLTGGLLLFLILIVLNIQQNPVAQISIFGRININLKYLLCVNSEQWKDRPMALSGTAFGDNYQYITITATLCKNTSKIKKCNPILVQQQGLVITLFIVGLQPQLQPCLFNCLIVQLQQILFQRVQFMKNVLCMKKIYIDFYSKQVGQTWGSFRTNNLIIIQYFFKHYIEGFTDIFQTYQNNTDVGLITDSIKQNLAISQSYLPQSQNFYNGQYIIYHLITLDLESAIYDRFYVKLQQILGSLGGLWQVIYFIVKILIGPTVYTIMNLQMANKIFSFGSSNNSDPINAQPSSVSPINQKVNQEKIISIIQRPQRVNQRSFKYPKLRLIDILQLLYGCRNKEKKLLNYATDKISSKLDVIFILKKLENLILNDEQLKLFEFLPKPVIPLDLFDKGNEEK